nr:MAG: RNA-dependent RNA polymerase [brine shrimp noda-like virus 1]UNI73865.1 MAG: RNA-dependent RNA polymerase [brine shrimp noda-like virus 1]
MLHLQGFPTLRCTIARVAVPTVLCVGAYVVLKNVDYRGLVSMLCEVASSEPVNVADLSRDVFTSCEVPEVVPTPGHTHPSAAASRNAGVRLASDVATRMGASMYVVQMSKADQRRGFRGSRQWYWAKDTHVENRADAVAGDDLVYICDTDYYIDMPELLSAKAQPVILYGAVPAEAVTRAEDSATFFNENGELITRVAGGGQYQHHLWDYAGDSIVVKRRFLGITYKLITYAIERKQVSDHRQIILLAPIKQFRGLAAWLASWIVDGRELTRFDPIVHTENGKFVRFSVHSSDTTLVTTARPNTMLCCTVPAELDDAVASVARLGTTNLMMPTVASWLGSERRAQSTVLTEYHRSKCGAKTPTVYPVEKGVRAYQYDPETYDQDAKPKLEAFMTPLVHGAFAPISNTAGERQCVEGRINKFKKPEPKPCQFRDQCLREFIDLVVDGVTLEPVDYADVAEKQTRPIQKLSLLKAAVSGPHLRRILKCFIKAEAYGDVKDPRNISTYNDVDKLSMSQYCMALAKHMKQFRWYAPGMTPLEVAIRVAEICLTSSRFVNVSDFTRMDGTISYYLRLVERGVLMKTFVNHRAALNELLKRNVDNTGMLPNGTRFEQGSSHGSGCAGTSLFQTMRAAFCAYLAFRHSRKADGAYYGPREAFDSLGIHSGDDGLDGDLPVESHIWAAKKIGLIIEACTVERGFPGVNFLARYYSEDVWSGRTDSMCDVKRQLAKFHTTVRLPNNVLCEHKLVEKAMAFTATDGNTPVIGPLCKRVLSLSSFRPRVTHGIANWWARFEQSEQFPNNNADGWMDVEFHRQFPEFDHRIFDDWLAGTKTATEILEAPLCAEPKGPTPSTASVVVDGDVLPARCTAEVQTDEQGAMAYTTPSPPEPTARKNKAGVRKKVRVRSPHSRGRDKILRKGPKTDPSA